MIVEGKLRWVFDDINWQGILDGRTPLGDETVLILDYKTTGNPKNIKDAEEFRKDVPAIVYANGALQKMPTAKHVIGLWIYIYPTSSGVTARPVVFYWPDCRGWVDGYVKKELAPHAAAMVAIAKTLGKTTLKVVQESVPVNPTHCRYLGVGCDYAKHCNQK